MGVGAALEFARTGRCRNGERGHVEEVERARGDATHHPSVESMTANPVAGPMASLVDRTRDVVRSMMNG